MDGKIKLAILGATGMAGREALLHQAYLDEAGEIFDDSSYNYAEITCVTASPKSAGKSLGIVLDDKERALMRAYGSFWSIKEYPDYLRELEIDPTDPDIIAEKADYAISALGSDVAKDVEAALVARGVHVFSNASSYRWHEKVPLLIPEVNWEHIRWVEAQETPGNHVCNPNCTTAGFVPLLKALEDMGYSIECVHLTTIQALSGKGDAITKDGYVMAARGNVRDDWTDKKGYNAEEWKSSAEPQKILGRIRTKGEVMNELENVFMRKDSRILPIDTQTSRGCVQDGHLECLITYFHGDVDAREIMKQLRGYKVPDEVARLPTTPQSLFSVSREMPSPKGRFHHGGGMQVFVGDAKQHSPDCISLWTLTHNLRRGATWAGRQGLELYLREYKGMFK